MPTRRAIKKNIVIEQGNGFAWPLRLSSTSITGEITLRDTSDYTSEFAIRQTDYDGDVVFSASEADYITVGTTPAPREISTAYGLGQWVVPDTGMNGFIYECTTAGTSSGGAITWPELIGDTVSDGTAVWTCIASDEKVANLYLSVPSDVTEILTDWNAGVYTWKIADAFGNAQRIFHGSAMLSREAT